jgi:hypothetical protein
LIEEIQSKNVFGKQEIKESFASPKIVRPELIVRSSTEPYQEVCDQLI